MDSMPRLRRLLIFAMAAEARQYRLADLVSATGYAQTTVLRVLEDLTVHRVVERVGAGTTATYALSRLARRGFAVYAARGVAA